MCGKDGPFVELVDQLKEAVGKNTFFNVIEDVYVVQWSCSGLFWWASKIVKSHLKVHG